ncbi:MAG: dTMP kinase [Thermodesulfobacteriota bacterium]|nr:dTMP kinase [Thermodesulfobacteriota bacterium]
MFITLEGIEGAGKSTQVPHIVAFLEARGHRCEVTREPGGTSLGRRIRTLLLDPANHDMVPTAELFLYAADRAQHVGACIIPALNAGKTVVCDRFFDATEAYQGHARGLDMDLIQQLNPASGPAKIRPDLTFLFDLSPETGLARAWERIKQNGKERADCRFENEAIVFHERVRQGYLTIARREPDRFVLVDAAKPAEAVRTQIEAGLDGFLTKRNDDTSGMYL